MGEKRWSTDDDRNPGIYHATIRQALTPSIVSQEIPISLHQVIGMPSTSRVIIISVVISGHTGAIKVEMGFLLYSFLLMELILLQQLKPFIGDCSGDGE